MAYLLAALFDDRNTAECAARQLDGAGFMRENIHVWNRHDHPAMLRQGADQTGGDTMLGSLRSFFRDIFGEEHYDRHAYSDALEQGAILLVYTSDVERDVDKAAEIVDTFHPLQLDTPGGWRAAGVVHHNVSGASGAIPERRE
jgi:hypothetical protein